MKYRFLKPLLLAAFLAAFSYPALAADYFVSNTGSGSTCSEASPCDTIADVELLSLAAGDTINFNCGDTFSTETLNSTASGSSGSPITYQSGGAACPGTDAIIGSSSLNNGLMIEGHNWIDVLNLDIRGGGSSQGHAAVRVSNANNLTFDGGRSEVTRGGAGTETHNNFHIRPDAGQVTNVTIRNWAFENTARRLLFLQQVTGPINVEDSTFAYPGGIPLGDSAQFDAISDNSNESHYTRITVDVTNWESGADFAIDFVNGSGARTHTIDESTFLGSPGGSILHVAGNSGGLLSVTVSDTLFDNSADSDGGWMLLRDQASFTCNRSRYVNSTTTTQGGIRMREVNTAIGPIGVWNACTFELEAGATGEGILKLGDSSQATLDNATLVSRDNASRQYGIELEGNWDGSLTIRNSIGDIAVDPIISEVAGSTGTFAFSDNLWFGAAAPTTLFALQTEGNLDADDVGVVAPVNNDTFGDPLFASEDETSPLYLRLLLGSPGIGLGDPANLYGGATSTDLLGIPFNSLKPNAGARAHGIRQRAFHHMQQSELVPANDNAPLRAAA